MFAGQIEELASMKLDGTNKKEINSSPTYILDYLGPFFKERCVQSVRQCEL